MPVANRAKFVLASALLVGCTGHSPSTGASAPVAPQVVLDTLTSIGSRANPVRGEGPSGEREYFSRLRCRDGSAPWFERNGSIGVGPYGNVLDSYSLGCGGFDSTQVAYFDMYHAGYRETRPLPGFAIVAPGGPEPSLRRERPSPGCPPQDIPRDSVGPVALEFQVDVIAEQLGAGEAPRVPGASGRIVVQFVVDTTGRPELGTYQVLEGTPGQATAARAFVAGLRFRPAEHPVGCKVRQVVQQPIIFP